MNRVRMMALATMAGGLALSACATLEEGVGEAVGQTYNATLTGANVVGGGDTDGYGRAEISITDEFDQVCWDINELRGLGTITAAHVHLGAAGTNGPPVFALKRADEGGWKGCTDDPEWVQNRIEGNPQAFYVNVHTTEFPNGAIRGQLQD